MIWLTLADLDALGAYPHAAYGFFVIPAYHWCVFTPTGWYIGGVN